MERLIDAALVGTARTGDKVAAAGAPATALIAALPELTPARKLLLAAGAQAVYAQAGHAAGAVIPAADAAPADEFAACSTGAAHLLDQLLTRDETGILSEALTRLRDAQLRLPHRLVVAALEAGKRQTDLRPLLVPALDQRGRWLATKNPVWDWVTTASATITEALPDNAETRWQEGTSPERLAILRQLRAHAPTKARDWLAESWKSEKADFRAHALATFDAGLSLADEPFLEAALDDRGQAVRAEAAQLLTRQQGSALSRRMRERADTLLAYTPHKRGLLRSLAQALRGDAARGDLTVCLPEDLARDWQRDGVAPKPRAGLGERAWWFMCVLSAVPPAHWTTRFTTTPAELIGAATHHEWGQVVIEGWSRAAIATRDEAWALPLWRYWLGGYLRPQQERQQQGRVSLTELLHGLIAIMQGEAIALVGSDLLDDATRTEQPLWIEIAPLLPTPWLSMWGQRYLEISRARLKSLRPHDPWVRTFDTAARALPVEAFPQALQEWSIPEGQAWVAMEWRRATDTLTKAIALRQRLLKEIPR